jgi:hypothetical protein
VSGQLVGEVLAASDSLQARGLSERGFHALVAIAEKASASDRTASVRWDHVRAGLYGASKRTAQRAVEDATKAGVIELVEKGFRNQHGASRAPIYRIAPLQDDDTQVARSNLQDDDTQVSSSTELDDDKPELDDDKPSVDDDTQVSYLTFPYDGSIDGVAAVDAEPRCKRHLNIARPPPCPDCQHVRRTADRAAEERAHRLEAQRTVIRRAIDRCPECDQVGRLDDLTDCPNHPNFRLPERTNA